MASSGQWREQLDHTKPLAAPVNTPQATASSSGPLPDSSARVSARVRPLLRLKSAAPVGYPTEPKKDAQTAAPWAIPQKPAKRSNARSSAPKLNIKESGSKGAPAWTVSIGQKSGKGRPQTSFRVRGADVGFAVSLRFKDELGKWRELYCCYLSAGEWKAARKMTPANFTALIVGKIEDRKGKEKADATKLDDLIARIHAIE